MPDQAPPRSLTQVREVGPETDNLGPGPEKPEQEPEKPGHLALEPGTVEPERDRVDAEQDRVDAEQDRVDAEQNRVDAEQDSVEPEAAALPAGSTLEAVIGERVRQYRQASSLSSAELAFRSGMSRAMVSRVESATTSSSLSTLQRLAEGLNIPVTALFRGVDSDREAVYTPAGHGALTVRSGTRHGHQYRSLGHLRGTGETALEPTLVTLTEASMVFPLFQHPGEEFLYLLEGVMVYGHGAYRYRLSPGDSLLIDGEGPHGPLELVELPVRFLAISQHHT